MDKTFLSLVIVFVLAFAIFAAFVVFNKPLTTLTRASEELTLSPQTSLIFAWPLSAPADGTTESTITIFARNKSGKPLPDKQVSITTTLGDMKESTVTTDSDGKALFHLTSSSQGVAEIKAIIDNIEIERKISVKFE